MYVNKKLLTIYVITLSHRDAICFLIVCERRLLADDEVCLDGESIGVQIVNGLD